MPLPARAAALTLYTAHAIQLICVGSVACRSQLLLALSASARGASISESVSGVEHCVSSRWGFTCFSRAGTRVGGLGQRSYRAVLGGLSATQLRRYGARGMMLSAGLVFGREVLRDTMALPRLLANGDVAHATLPGAMSTHAAAATTGEESAGTVNTTEAEVTASAEGTPESADGHMPLPPSRSDLL